MMKENHKLEDAQRKDWEEKTEEILFNLFSSITHDNKRLRSIKLIRNFKKYFVEIEYVDNKGEFSSETLSYSKIEKILEDSIKDMDELNSKYEIPRLKELLEKEDLTVQELLYLDQVKNYLLSTRKKREKKLKSKSFKKQTINKKLLIVYDEFIVGRIANHQTKLIHKQLEGEALFKTKTEINQKISREIDAIIRKILSGQSINYKEKLLLIRDKDVDGKSNVAKIMNYPALIQRVEKRIKAMKILCDKEEDKIPYEIKIQELEDWKHFIDMVNYHQNLLEGEFLEYSEDTLILKERISNELIKKINHQENSYDEVSSSFSHQEEILETLLPYISDEFHKLVGTKDLEKIRLLKEAEEVLNTLYFCIPRLETADHYMCEEVLKAYFSALEIVNIDIDNKTYKNLQEEVKKQIKRVEKIISTELVKKIKEDKIDLPKKYKKI